MRSRMLSCLGSGSLALAVGLGAVGAAGAALGDSDFVPNQAIVRPREGVSIGVINARYGSATLREVISRRWFLLSPPATLSEDAFVQLLLTDPDVEVAELNFVAADTEAGGGSQSIFLPRSVVSFENDPTPSTMGVPDAQGMSRGAGVKVAVVDSGVDVGHPMLAGRIAAGGFNFIEQNTDVSDLPDGIDTNGNGFLDEMAGHGTFVSGLVSRVAPSAMILPIRVLDSDGVSNAFLIAQGVYHALDEGAQVVNVSIGTQGESLLLASLASEVEAAGVFFVASAGNDGSSSPARQPASLRSRGVIGVAATTLQDVRADFSNYGSWVSVSAPGVGVVSLLPGGGFGEASGTSFAAPLVSGVAALLRSTCPAASFEELRGQLLGTARSINAQNPSYVGQLGSGRVDAAAALGAPPNDGLLCWCDVNLSGSVEFGDIAIVLANFSRTYPAATVGPGDASRNWVVTFDDVTRVLVHLGSR